jgi:hypothetical protein
MMRVLLEGRLVSYHPDGPHDDAKVGKALGLYGCVKDPLPYSMLVRGPHGSAHCVVAGRYSAPEVVVVAMADCDSGLLEPSKECHGTFNPQRLGDQRGLGAWEHC